VQELANVSPNQVVSLIENAESLPGDYNSDGSVDAADYVVWRKTDANNLVGYALWRENFAMTSFGSGVRLASTSVPESSSVVFLATAILVLVKPWRLARSGSNPVFRSGNCLYWSSRFSHFDCLTSAARKRF
jgi:hypothetical protein